jgi:hypothetical protein
VLDDLMIADLIVYVLAASFICISGTAILLYFIYDRK